MPKTTVDENHLTPGRENDIRAPWKILAMQSIAVTLLRQQSTNQAFRTGVLRTHFPHLRGALGWRQAVHGLITFPALSHVPCESDSY